jgi:hypothetical protein
MPDSCLAHQSYLLCLPVCAAPGAIIFHGPVAEALPHFARLGFDCPPRKDLASFLQEVSTPAGQLAYASDVN